MRQLLTLPKVTGFRLTGFQPIFRHDVEMSLNSGPHIILGGNGLGKTTIMQAVVFGLTGGAGEAIEGEKLLRWDNRYFRGRLNAHQLHTALVEVDFLLGKTQLSVRRRLNGSQVSAFRNGQSGKWIEEQEKADKAFNDALAELGGYQSTNDFAFIVHRLLYLPESRRLLAWDTNAQVRIFMMLNQDASREAWFNDRRDQLVKMDSKKRHIHVALGRAQASLTTLMEFDEQGPELAETDEVASTELATSLTTLVDSLRKAARATLTMEDSVQTTRKNLSEVSTEVEALHEQIEAVEASLIESFLSEQEKESA